MASFPVHLAVAMTVSAISATVLITTGLATPLMAIGYFSLGTIGGIAPDLDADKSTPLRIGLWIIPILGASILLVSFASKRSIIELCAIWLGAFLILRYAMINLFPRLTIHRGVFHSLPAAVLFGCITAIITARWGNFSPLTAWIAGFFAAGGYITHLILDEIYSVDLYGAKLKKSFGTAVKIFSWRNPLPFINLYTIIIGTWQFTPNIQPFVRTFTNNRLWQRVEQRLLPR